MRGGFRTGAGRKPVDFDLEQLEKLAALLATDEEIAAWFHCSPRTIEMRRKDPQFKEVMERGKAMGRISVRRAQMKLLDAGNATMGVWLGKQLLGQRDVTPIELTGAEPWLLKLNFQWRPSMPSSRKQKRISEAAKIILDPVLCADQMLCCRLWLKQQEILRSVDTHRKTAVKACHASGKTFVAAIAVLWWLITRPNGIVVTTAPTWLQVERVLWGELHSAILRAAYKFPRPSATKLDLGPNRYAIGISTNETVRLQGFHGDVLIIIDEAPGVSPEIYEAIEGILAGGDCRILAIGRSRYR